MFGRTKETRPSGRVFRSRQHENDCRESMGALLTHDVALWLETLPPEDRQRAQKLWLHGWYAGYLDDQTQEMTPCPVPATA